MAKRRIYYVSAMSHPEVLEDIFSRTRKNPGYAMQKFNRMVADGLVRNGAEVTAVSSPPVVPGSLRKVENYSNSEFKGISFKHITVIDIPLLRQLYVFLSALFKVAGFGIGKNKEESKVIICDMLNVGVTAGALLGASLTGVKKVGILTDMPGMMIGASGVKNRIAAKMMKSLLGKYDGYVFLTEAMNTVVNLSKKPYIVMEGLVDKDDCADRGFTSEFSGMAESGDEKRIIYAGGLFRQYGVGNLIEGFMKVKDTSLRLDLYGSGDMENEIENFAKQDSRIRFHGVVTNEEILEAERGAWLLINPRPTTEDFVKYSFPSKNMEYMLSGTPVLTTHLPGMPEEYLDYVFTIEDESADGIAGAIEKLLNTYPDEIKKRGEDARTFVRENKNQLIRGKEILELADRL